MSEPDADEKKKVLILDDEPNVRTYLETLLADNGYETVCAENGVEGMEKVKAGKPDLICLDISMPEQSGIRFYRDLKEDADLASIPVVVVTAVTGYAGDPYGYLKFMQKQANIPEPDGFFPKPIDKDAFLETVEKLVS